jgi:hypothetical protein
MQFTQTVTRLCPTNCKSSKIVVYICFCIPDKLLLINKYISKTVHTLWCPKSNKRQLHMLFDKATAT